MDFNDASWTPLRKIINMSVLYTVCCVWCARVCVSVSECVFVRECVCVCAEGCGLTATTEPQVSVPYLLINIHNSWETETNTARTGSADWWSTHI